MATAIGSSKVNRREFLKCSGTVAAGAAVLGSLTPTLHAAGDDTIRLALIGCGGRGTGAVGDALSVPDGGPMKLYAMAEPTRSSTPSPTGARRSASSGG